MNPKYPVYIISKGRWVSRLTSKALENMKMPYRIVVEAQEYKDYASVIEPSKILVLPLVYQQDYDTCDEMGNSMSKGSGPARNFCWDNAVELGEARHWLIDDNIEDFHRLNRNMKPVVTSGTIFKVAEEFVDRYTNIALAGFNYYSFCKVTDKLPPFVLNTRIYSCMLIRNDIPYKWRGRYNEDTDLSLRVLKAGYCTVQFNAFLAGKVTTQRMNGGNTSEIYREGTLDKSRMIERLHPDVAGVVWKFNRWHHQIDYRPFKKNELIRKEGLVTLEGINNYGMKLIEMQNG